MGSHGEIVKGKHKLRLGVGRLSGGVGTAESSDVLGVSVIAEKHETFDSGIYLPIAPRGETSQARVGYHCSKKFNAHQSPGVDLFDEGETKTPEKGAEDALLTPPITTEGSAMKVKKNSIVSSKDFHFQ